MTRPENEIHGTSPPAETGSPGRAGYLELLDDPYFEYLLARKAKAQTRTFLAAVGTAIALLLGYAGFKVESAKDVIAGYQAELAGLRDEAREAAYEASAHESEIRKKLEVTKELTDQSQILSTALLQTAETNVVNSRDLQRDVFDQHRNLIESVRQINTQAAANVGQVQTLLDHLEAEQIPDKLAQLHEAEVALKQVAADFGAVEDLHAMQELNAKLVRARTRETITLRKYNSRSVRLPDLEEGRPAGDGLPLRAMFSVGDLGRKFRIEWAVEGRGVANLAAGVDEVKAPKKYTIDAAGSNLFAMGDTGYEYVVEYVNYGLFVRDFVMIRIRPVRDGSDERPSGLRLAGLEAAGATD